MGDLNLCYRPRALLSFSDNKPLVRGKLSPAAQKRGFARGSNLGKGFAANLSLREIFAARGKLC